MRTLCRDWWSTSPCYRLGVGGYLGVSISLGDSDRLLPVDYGAYTLGWLVSISLGDSERLLLCRRKALPGKARGPGLRTPHHGESAKGVGERHRRLPEAPKPMPCKGFSHCAHLPGEAAQRQVCATTYWASCVSPELPARTNQGGIAVAEVEPYTISDRES